MGHLGRAAFCSFLQPCPNIPIGIVQSIDDTLKSRKTAKISLIAKPHVIDWVQILKVNI
jgi:rod shape-determining protein MreC